MKCKKCLTLIPEDLYRSYAFFNGTEMEKFSLCVQCCGVYDEASQGLLFQFLEEDYGTFPIRRIDKDMIGARKRRSTNIQGELDKWKEFNERT